MQKHYSPPWRVGGLAAKVQLSSSCAALFVTKRGQAVLTRSPHSFPIALIISRDIKRKCISTGRVFPSSSLSIIGSCICQTSSGDFSAKLEGESGAEVHSLNGLIKPACLLFGGAVLELREITFHPFVLHLYIGDLFWKSRSSFWGSVSNVQRSMEPIDVVDGEWFSLVFLSKISCLLLFLNITLLFSSEIILEFLSSSYKRSFFRLNSKKTAQAHSG